MTVADMTPGTRSRPSCALAKEVVALRLRDPQRRRHRVAHDAETARRIEDPHARPLVIGRGRPLHHRRERRRRDFSCRPQRRLELRSRLLVADARTQPAEHPAQLPQHRVLSRIGVKESFRHHADDRECGAVQIDRLPQDVRVAAKRTVPERIAQDRRRRAQHVVFAREGPAERRAHAERVELVARDEVDRAKAMITHDNRPRLAEIGPACQVRETPRLVAKPPIRRIRNGSKRLNTTVGADLRPGDHVGSADKRRPVRGPGKAAQLARLRDRQRLPEDGVDLAENGGAGADTQRQRENRDDAEAGRLEEQADGESEILPDKTHRAHRALSVTGARSENSDAPSVIELIERASMVLRKGDHGDEVKILQHDLNKLGAMLLVDGDFGPGTRNAVISARQLLGRPGLPDATGVADDDLQHALAAAADPCPELTSSGMTFIAREEVSDAVTYERRYQLPTCPPAPSGVTIGIGYDCRFVTRSEFTADWSDFLPAAAIAKMLGVLGQVGTAALLETVSTVTVPLPAAMQVFARRSVPKYLADTRTIYPEVDDLSPARRTALVSLVYNRGTDLTGDRRREMRTIQELLAAGRLDDVDEQFDAMVRLWDPAIAGGLITRRHAEAALWRSGFAAVQLE